METGVMKNLNHLLGAGFAFGLLYLFATPVGAAPQ